MILFGMPLIDLALVLALGMAGLAMFMAAIRLALGPSVSDRVVALDTIGTIGVGFIAAISIRTDKSVLLDAATVVALVAFLATVGFARYVERRVHDE